MLTLLTHSFPTAPCSDLRRNKPPAAPAFAGATSYAISASHPQGGPAPSEIDLRPQPEGVRRIIAVARRGRDAGVVDPQLSVVGGQADEVDRRPDQRQQRRLLAAADQPRIVEVEMVVAGVELNRADAALGDRPCGFEPVEGAILVTAAVA